MGQYELCLEEKRHNEIIHEYGNTYSTYSFRAHLIGFGWSKVLAFLILSAASYFTHCENTQRTESGLGNINFFLAGGDFTAKVSLFASQMSLQKN